MPEPLGTSDEQSRMMSVSLQILCLLTTKQMCLSEMEQAKIRFCDHNKSLKSRPNNLNAAVDSLLKCIKWLNTS